MLVARQRLVPLLGAAVSIGVLALVVLWALDQPAPELPSGGGALAAVAGAIVLYGLATAARAERWLILMAENGAPIARADAHGLMVVNYMGNTVLPARGGDALRAVVGARRSAGDHRTVIGTLVAERLLDVVVLGLLFVLLAYGVLHRVVLPERAGVGLAAALVGAALVAAAVAVLVLHRTGHLRRVTAFLAPLSAATRNLRGRHGTEVLALTLAVWALEGGTWLVTGLAAGVHLTPVEALYLLALASVFAMIPAGPGQAGTLDAAVLLGLRALERSPAAALGYLLLLRFVVFLPITIAGAIVVATRYGGLGRLRGLLAAREAQG